MHFTKIYITKHNTETFKNKDWLYKYHKQAYIRLCYLNLKK